MNGAGSCRRDNHHTPTKHQWVAPWRNELRISQRATVRFKTPPGKQLQADFWQCSVVTCPPLLVQLL
jgi:hypothetical protein